MSELDSYFVARSSLLKPTSGVVGPGDDLLLGLEGVDSDDGSKDFLAHNLGIVGNVGEDGGLDEEALVADTVSAGDELALGLAGFDVL